MKNFIFFVVIFAIFAGCRRNNSLSLGEKFDGEGFIVTHDPTKFPVVFFPARALNKDDYIKSLSNKKVGDGILIGIYNIAYVVSISNPRKRLKLLNSKSVNYPLDSIYVLPVRLKYHGLEEYGHQPRHIMSIATKQFVLNKRYISNAVQIDSIIFLPYALNK